MLSSGREMARNGESEKGKGRRKDETGERWGKEWKNGEPTKRKENEMIRCEGRRIGKEWMSERKRLNLNRCALTVIGIKLSAWKLVESVIC